jgi:hypothetical protein
MRSYVSQHRKIDRGLQDLLPISLLVLLSHCTACIYLGHSTFTRYTRHAIVLLAVCANAGKSSYNAVFGASEAECHPAQVPEELRSMSSPHLWKHGWVTGVVPPRSERTSARLLLLHFRDTPQQSGVTGYHQEAYHVAHMRYCCCEYLCAARRAQVCHQI